MKPFILSVVEPRETWFGKVKFKVIVRRAYKYPEQMVADASYFHQQGKQVITHEPDPRCWHDDRVGATPIVAEPGVDAPREYWIQQANIRGAHGRELEF